MLKRAIIGGVATLVIGGAGYTVSQSDIVDNFSNETGMSQEQAQKYVEDAQGDLESFSKIGQDLVDDGNSIMSNVAQIDCVQYTYEWETPSLSCNDGVTQMRAIGNGEITLGNCYKSLDTDLGQASRTRIGECVSDIDAVNASYASPVVDALLDQKQITEMKNANAYNKSVLQAALRSQ